MTGRAARPPAARPAVVVYCQHVLGVGHLCRSLEIAKALDRFRVILVSGGEPFPVSWPEHVRLEALPALMMDEEFGALRAGPGRDLAAVKRERAARLFALFERERPAVFLAELYPFGRKAFAFELDPLLEAIRQGRFGPVLTACSLRDILVEKRDQAAYERRVLERLNACFDLVLVHADPALQRLDETFDRTTEIGPPVLYTGFVSPGPPVGAGPALRQALGLGPDEALIVVSAGGGKVGGELLEAALGAVELLAERRPARLALFAGPYLDEAVFRRLRARAVRRPGFAMERFAADFPAWLAACDLSVSMAGYNTCMNILAAGAKALVHPFGQNREQGLRAAKLAALGLVEILRDHELPPAAAPALADRLAALLDAPAPPPSPLALDGAARTARLLAARLAGQGADEARGRASDAIFERPSAPAPPFHD